MEMELLKVTANSQTLEQIFKTVFTIILVELVVIITGVKYKNNNGCWSKPCNNSCNNKELLHICFLL